MEGAPEVPAALTEAVLRAASTSTESIFLPWVAERITLRWSEGDDVNLGLTRFEAKTTDLVRARHLRLDPGPITIELHPDLAQDERMMHHVYAHELLHASGLTAHSEEHDRLTAEVARLRRLRNHRSCSACVPRCWPTNRCSRGPASIAVTRGSARPSARPHAASSAPGRCEAAGDVDEGWRRRSVGRIV